MSISLATTSRSHSRAAQRGAVELTRPVIKGGRFTSWIERIYLSDGADLVLDKRAFDDGDRADNFDPLVVRKK
jgi:hypothetical protein